MAGIGQKGSLLVFPNVEIKWNAAGEITRDTFLQINNGHYTPVGVQLYFRNGDPPLEAVDGAMPERSHPGFNHAGCRLNFGWYESRYWSAATGQPDGCSFSVLDTGNPMGRPDPEVPGGRVLRGCIYAWAVDPEGAEMNWNSLSGTALVTDYASFSGWEYPAVGFDALAGQRGDTLPEPGVLRLDDIEYERPPNQLFLNFWASGTYPLTPGSPPVHVDTLLTLLPASQDFRQNNDGCVVTKASFDIRNMFGDFLSGTHHCVECWDQSRLSSYGIPNHFFFEHLHTVTGTALIDGHRSVGFCGPESVQAALLGVSARLLTFNPLAGMGDWNQSGPLDLEDFAVLQGCIEASGAGGVMADETCLGVFDIDADGDVDLKDFCAFDAAIAQTSQTFSGFPVTPQGEESAIVRYDVPAPPAP
ncbi:MAG: hypothetical protein ACPGXK_12850 [Phycisphaerae bacterium]